MSLHRTILRLGVTRLGVALKKFNPYHDSRGRFASAGAGRSGETSGGGGSTSARYPSVSIPRSHRMTVNTVLNTVLTSPMNAAGVFVSESAKDGTSISVAWPYPYSSAKVSAYVQAKEKYVERDVATDSLNAKDAIGVGLETVVRDALE